MVLERDLGSIPKGRSMKEMEKLFFDVGLLHSRTDGKADAGHVAFCFPASRLLAA